MDRRHYLGALAGTLTGLTGCTGSGANAGSSEEPETRTARSTTQPKTETQTPPPETEANNEPTVESTPTPERTVEKRLSFGDWITHGKFGYTVTDFETRSSFTDTFAYSDRDGKQQMPEGKLLFIGWLNVKNITQQEQYEPFGAEVFAAISGEERYPNKGTLQHPDYSSRVNFDWFELASNYHRFSEVAGSGEHAKIASGEKRKYWFGTVVPESFVGNPVEIGFDADAETGYEIRWVKS